MTQDAKERGKGELVSSLINEYYRLEHIIDVKMVI